MPTSHAARHRLRRGTPPRVALLLAALCLLVGVPGIGATAGRAAGAATYLQVSTSSDRSGAFALNGAVLAGKVYVFVPTSSAVTGASFWIDDPTTKTSPAQVEDSAPWDLAGGTPLAKAWDLRLVSIGLHTVTVVLTVQGQRVVESASFLVVSDAWSI